MNDQNVPSGVELERYIATPPQFIGLEVTQRCNLQCPMCSFHGRVPIQSLWEET